MPLPETVRVKLSSEAAESISLTPVVVQELPLRQLLEHLLAVAGKDARRIREMLLRGSLVSGASRFRWQGWDAAPDELATLLATFPDSDPSRAFAPERAVHAVLRGARGAIELPRAAAERKGLLQRACFWDALMEVAARGVVYAGYSYRARADRYTRAITSEDSVRLRQACDLIRYTTLREQVRVTAIAELEILVER